jgi:predicted ATPase/class 3 adenylate cyclase
MALASGTVTFLFTDIEGSTRLWESAPEEMRVALARHDEIVGHAIEAHSGTVFKNLGDGAAAVFNTPSQAIRAGVEAQRGLAAESWATDEPLRVRMGLHTGEAEQRDGDYFGTTLNRTARLMAIGHGGQILVSGATAPLVEDIVTLVYSGEHRLRDLDRPMRVFQVGNERFPPLRSLDAFPGNLPLQLSSFVGREEETRRVGKALEQHRLVTLTGVGGVGKTRLALQVAGEMLPRFPDGAWLVELAPVRDPDRVTDAFAGVFQVAARPGLTLGDSLTAFLRDQTLLIVVDNCEHLLRPVAALIATIEKSCPGVRILATSREGLGLQGEILTLVPPLAVPLEEEPAERVVDSEAVRLFAERARATRADFEVNDTNVEAVARICTRLDGVPLAIELAAARINTLSTSELALRLDHRFRLLSGGDRLAVERHQTLRATIDWSYDLCTEPERRLLARLSVFAGGATLDGVETVCGFEPIEIDDVIDLLGSLVARSLVIADHGVSDTRYRMLETIRQYGDEHLAETAERDVMRTRHCDYFIAFAAVATPQVFGPGEREWARRLAAENDNFQSAMRFALECEDVDRVMGLICQLPTHEHQMDRLIVFDPQRVLALPGASNHSGVARVLWEAADRANTVNDFEGARRYLMEAEDAVARLGPGPGYLDVITLSMMLRRDMSDFRSFSEISLAVSARALESGRLAIAAEGLAGYVGVLAWIDPPRGADRATEAVAMARRSGMPTVIAENLAFHAISLASTDLETAERLLLEAVAVSTETWPTLQVQCTAAARMGEWDLLVRLARRLFWLDKRSGVVAQETLLGLFNFVSRALASHDPEGAAVLQGAVIGLSQTTAAGAYQPSNEESPSHGMAGLTRRSQDDPFGDFLRQVRRECTAAITRAIGEERMRERRAEGAAMDRELACAYLRTHIDAYLAALDEAG